MRELLSDTQTETMFFSEDGKVKRSAQEQQSRSIMVFDGSIEFFGNWI